LGKRDIYIVDTYGVLFKIYYAIPLVANREGQPTNVLTGFIKTIQNFQKNFSVQHLIFALEGEGKNFRKDISPDYKINRGSTPETFNSQFKIILEWLEKMGFPTAQKNHYEADDIIATLSKKYSDLGDKVYILSEDKDFIQLLSQNIHILRNDSGKYNIFNAEDCYKKYKVQPHQFIDYQALVGDAVDNVSGVKGIGKVTASKLLSEFETLDNIYNNLDNTTKAIAKKLLLGKDDAVLSKQLVTLKQDISLTLPKTGRVVEQPLSVLIDEMIFHDIQDSLKYLINSGFISHSEVEKKDRWNFTFKTTILDNFDDAKKVIQGIPQRTIIAFDTETTGVNQFEDKIVGFSFAFDEVGGYYVPINHNQNTSLLFDNEQISETEAKELLELLSNYKLVGHNFKFDKHIVFNNLGVKLPLYSDTMILAWLYNSSESISLDNLSYNLLKHRKIKFKDLVKTGDNFSSVEIDVASTYAVEDVIATFKLYKFFTENLSNKLLKLAKTLEMPFSEALFEMEQVGIQVSLDTLQNLENDFSDKILQIETEIYKLAGDTFNLNSPKQVGNILFDRLDIETPKRKTDEATLNSIKGDYPIIAKILEYRSLAKILSTYIKPLKVLGQKGRIHTSFGQTGTVTGRLTSQNPNLQNIPVGSGIRKIFVAKEGYSLLSLDYSQIELRFFAHFSKDEVMVEAFRNGEDIHSVVAQKLNIERNVAKTVNFGLLYGMGSKKLSETLGISLAEAGDIISNYFETFQNLDEFQTKIHRKVLTEKYLETILGRKRYFQYEHQSSSRYQQVEASIERASFNTLFQGSSADLIKLAMLKIHEKIIAKKFDSKLLLQIHDELIFEIKDEFIEEYLTIFKRNMETGLKLKVPIVVNAKVGKNWGEMKSI